MLPFDPQELLKLKDEQPDKYWEVVARFAAQTPRDEVERVRLEQLAIIAASGETFEAFEAYYEGIHGNKMLPHLRKLMLRRFEARQNGKIWVLLGFRGSRKTTAVQITEKSWLHGLHPERTGVTTGANDPNAKLIAKSIAQIIESHPFFRMAFPHVVIYKERGWGAEGYFLRDNRMSVEEWTRQQAAVNDPSFVGGGYKSSEINGKHPTLYLSADDIHDIDSSGSPTEREAIKETLLRQILPTVVRENDKPIAPIELTGVPFAKDDSYQVLRQSGAVQYDSLPVMVKAKEGEGVYIDGKNPETGVVYEDIVGWWILTAPEIFGVKSIIEIRSLGKAPFWQMYMIDIEQAKNAGVTYYSYDHEKIGFDLPTYGGADPTSLDPDLEVGGKKHSSFALCYLCKLPDGGAVVKDGVLKPMGIEKAKLSILNAQSMFKNWKGAGVENVGVGKMFLQYLHLDSRVLAFDSNLKTPNKKGVADKLTRFSYEVGPHLDSGVIRISDENTPFLNALRRGLENFTDLDPKKPDESLDAMDSLYHAAKMIPETLRHMAVEDISPQGLDDRGGLWHPLMGVRYGR